MQQAAFEELLKRFSAAAEAGDGEAFAQCFTPDGVYHDYIYGDHTGRADIAHMMSDLFHRDAGPDYRLQRIGQWRRGHGAAGGGCAAPGKGAQALESAAAGPARHPNVFGPWQAHGVICSILL